MTSTLTAPKMVINENPYVGVADFFAACHARYSHLMGMQFDDAAPLTVVNLLRCDPESGETGLSEVSQQSCVCVCARASVCVFVCVRSRACVRLCL